MDYLHQVQYLCKKYNITPKRNLGQNFLIDEKVYQKIIETANLNSADLVLEVGAGFGLLTTKLLKKAKKVLAVELDKKFFQPLNKLTQVYKNLILIHHDIRQLSNKEIGEKLAAKKITNEIDDYKIIANLPYNISSYFLRKFLSYSPKPKYLGLLLQKELAERIIAPAGAMSLLAVMCQFYSEPKLIEVVDKSSFWPRPAVDSAIIQIKTINPKEKYQLPLNFNEKKFWQLLRIGFSARRKQLKNNLANGYQFSQELIKSKLKKIGLKEAVRAQELTIDNWLKIYYFFFL